MKMDQSNKYGSKIVREERNWRWSRTLNGRWRGEQGSQSKPLRGFAGIL